MRALIVVAIWLIAGLGATGLMAATLEQLVVPAPAGDGQGYAPPGAPPSGFLADLPRGASKQ